jgi:hypothetical protein
VDPIEAGLGEVFAAGGGALTLIVITTESAASIVAAAMQGEVAAKTILAAGDQLLRSIEQRSRANAMACALCNDNVFWRDEAPTAIGLLTPFNVDDVHVAVGLAFCEACAAKRTDRHLGLAMVTKLRAEWMPDLRVLPPMPAAGHA